MCAFIPTSRMCDSKKQFFGEVINGWLLVLVNLSKCLPCLPAKLCFLLSLRSSNLMDSIFVAKHFASYALLKINVFYDNA